MARKYYTEVRSANGTYKSISSHEGIDVNIHALPSGMGTQKCVEVWGTEREKTDGTTYLHLTVRIREGANVEVFVQDENKPRRA